MNISLTLNFDTMTELEAYLASRTATSTSTAAPVSSAPTSAPTPAPVVLAPVAAAPAPAPAPAVVVPGPSPAPAPAPTPAAPALVAVVSDATAVKTRIMERLKVIAASLSDQSELGKFITAFGVQRFSELPDDRLGQFEQLMNQTYPA